MPSNQDARFRALLTYRLEVSELNKDDLAERLAVSRSTFYRKWNNPSLFTLGEIRQMSRCIGLDAGEVAKAAI